LRRQPGCECGCGRSFSDGEHRPATQSGAAAAAKRSRVTHSKILPACFGASFAEYFAPRFFFEQLV
jgi:hypothetical protein